MSYRLRHVVFVVLLVSLLPNAPGQQPALKNRPTDTRPKASVDSEMMIRIGQPLADTEGILRVRQIGFHEGGFSFGRRHPDQANLAFTLDEDRTLACVFYSKSTKKVTGMSLIFFPSRAMYGKAYRSWLKVKSLQLNEDRSYVAHFAPPLTDDERQQLRRNQPAPQLPPGPSDTRWKGKLR